MRFIHSRAFIAISAVAILAVSACSADTEAPDEESAGADTVQYTFQSNTAGPEEDPVFEEVTVEIPKNPKKIVVFEMQTVDIIGALGGEVSGTPLDFVPEYLQDALADDAFNSGSLFEADLIEIESQQPDLIIVGGRSSALYTDLSAIAPTIDLGLKGDYVSSLESNVDLLGQVLGAEDEAASAIEEVKAGIDEAKAITAEAGNGLGLIVSGGELSALAPAPEDAQSSQIRSGLMYDVFGVEPSIADIEAATHGEPISFEFLVENDPENLLVLDRDAATGESSQSAEAVLDNELVEQTSAGSSGQIYYLDPVAWYIVYGGLETTQIMIDDIKQMAA